MDKRTFLEALSALWIATLMLPGSWGCGGSVSRGASSSDEATETNSLASAFPDDLAVASLTASSSASSSLSAASLAAGSVKSATITSESPVEKKEDLGNLINFADEATFTAELGEMKNEINIFASAPNANCYGPNLNYTDHPDASGGEKNDGELPPGDLGIWTATEASTGEACVAAKLNNIIGQFENILNAGTKVVAATLGAASLDEALSELPAAGESSDLKAKANEELAENSVPVVFDSATLERETGDTAGGDPVFVTTLNGDMETTDGSATFETILEHIPMGEGETTALKSQESAINDDTYCGRLTQSFNIPSSALPTLGNCAGSDGLTRCTLVEYCKDSETSLTYHLRTAEFCGQGVACGTVDPANKKSGTNANGWGNNFYYTVCNVNPGDGSGSCAQVWQAGMGDGNTRVLNVTVEAGGESGCGYFGFGPDVAAASGVGSIDRMICNWAGPGNNHTGVAKAQRQCFTKDSAGKYVTDTASDASKSLAITYAPTNSCNKSASDATFTYSVKDDPSISVAAGVAVTNNLINLTDVDFTVPALPVVP